MNWETAINFSKSCAWFLLAWPAAGTRASTVVALPFPHGDSGNFAPFSIGGPGISMRYQQVYNACGFAPVTQGCLIRALGFNIRSGYAAGSTLQDVQIDMSTTSGSEDGLSADFASNVGSDDSIVYARGPLYVANSMPGAPPGFGVIITLTTPFLYYPSRGNLLMDVRIYQPAMGGFTPGAFDASTISGDGTSRVSAFGVGSPTGTTDTYGLITAFVVDGVPEPGSATLVMAAVGMLALPRRRALVRATERSRAGASFELQQKT